MFRREISMIVGVSDVHSSDIRWFLCCLKSCYQSSTSRIRLPAVEDEAGACSSIIYHLRLIWVMGWFRFGWCRVKKSNALGLAIIKIKRDSCDCHGWISLTDEWLTTIWDRFESVGVHWWWCIILPSEHIEYSCGLSHHIIRLGGGGALQSKTNSGRRKKNTLHTARCNAIVYSYMLIVTRWYDSY